MRRRAFLTDAVAVTALLSGCSRRQNGNGEDDRQAENWEERADRAIQSNRTSDLDILILDSSGDPIPDAEVAVEMQAHNFRFGTAVAADELVDAEDDDPYRAHLRELFNTTVLENAHKWNNWEAEETRELADRTVDWLRQHDLDVRGHAAIWQNLERGVVPDDVKEKVESNDPDRADYLAGRTTDHVWNIVHHYSGQLTEWDVLNEHLDYHEITQAISPDHPPQESPPLIEWFETAAAADSDSDFYYNDYDIITGGEERRKELETLITTLQDADAPIDGLGMQAHFDGQEAAIDPDELRELLDRYASFGIDLKVTEYDTYGAGWTEENEADHLRVVLKTLFSHPRASGFLMWGFWDGNHWRDNAPLFRDDWSEKPAYDVYTDLVFDEWWTDTSGTTDANGNYQTRAFHGDYKITVSDGDKSETVTTSLTDSENTITVEVE